MFAATIQLGTAQSPSGASLVIGVSTVAIGEPEDKVLATLTAAFDLEKQGATSSSWLVYEKRSVPRRLVANVFFKDGRLQQARRYWSPDDQTAAVPFATAVFGAVSQLVSEGRRSCVLDVGTNQSPSAEIKTAFIDCGDKRLEVTLTQGRVGQFANLDEVVGGRQ